jgi:hypothetical protein
VSESPACDITAHADFCLPKSFVAALSPALPQVRDGRGTGAAASADRHRLHQVSRNTSSLHGAGAAAGRVQATRSDTSGVDGEQLLQEAQHGVELRYQGATLAAAAAVRTRSGA